MSEYREEPKVGFPKLLFLLENDDNMLRLILNSFNRALAQTAQLGKIGLDKCKNSCYN